MIGATRPLAVGPCSLAFPFLQGWPCILLWHTMPGTGWLSSNSEMVGYRSWYVLIKYRYVVYLPLWKMMEFVSWDDDIPNWMESHNPAMFQSPPTRISTSPSRSRIGPSNLWDWQNLPFISHYIYIYVYIYIYITMATSGKLSHNYGKSPFSMGTSTISMVMFNGYVKLPEGYILKKKTSKHHVCWFITMAEYEKLDWTLHDYIARLKNWLVVSTPLKNISQLGWLFPMYGKS